LGGQRARLSGPTCMRRVSPTCTPNGQDTSGTIARERAVRRSCRESFIRSLPTRITNITDKTYAANVTNGDLERRTHSLRQLEARFTLPLSSIANDQEARWQSPSSHPCLHPHHLNRKTANPKELRHILPVHSPFGQLIIVTATEFIASHALHPGSKDIDQRERNRACIHRRGRRADVLRTYRNTSNSSLFECPYTSNGETTIKPSTKTPRWQL
jgi:hypothetical protein